MKSSLHPGKCILVIIFLAAISRDLFAQYPVKSPFRMMFYNVENLFDTFDDQDTEDDEFMPEGTKRWTFKRYTAKINSIYKVIMAAGEGWEPPSIIGLCEVENRHVVEDLINETYLSGFNYGIIHEDSRDPRGIEVCIIYRKDRAVLLSHKYIEPVEYGISGFKTRSILYSKWLIDRDTIDIFLNHWPSKRGGALAGEPTRTALARLLLMMSDSLNKSTGGQAKIVMAGDFNCTPVDSEMLMLCEDSDRDTGNFRLVNLCEPLSEKGSGTYRYMGTWEMLDQVIVSAPLLYSSNGLKTERKNLVVFNPDFLLKKDNRYPGPTPYSTYYGFRYQGGFSDHLPLILDLLYHPVRFP